MFFRARFRPRGGHLDDTARAGATHRYQLHVLKNSTDSQLPYPLVCGAPSAEVRVTVPPIAPRRRAVH
ncbi:MAG: hypothetical protein WB973_06480 [Thermoanaerobaculia bacterium]